jgi:tetratricopeptide (TPR) repeat protein
MLYNHKRDYDRALADFDQAIRLNPADVPAYVDRGIAYSAKGDHERAAADFDQAIRLDPKHAVAYANRGTLYLEMGDYDRAIPDLDRAIQLDPNRANYLNEGCWVHAVANRDLATARTYCDSALRLAPNDVPTLNSRGLVDLQQQRWADYDAAARARPGKADDLYGRGIAALRLGRTAEGQADLAAALKLDPKIGETFAGYGIKP